MERRLAAILIADVVGYTRLSQLDEEGTRACFQVELREVFEPKISAHHGRLVKVMGDGLLVEFHSVVDAVRCAAEVQSTEVARNAERQPDRRLEFRIAINLGDVIIEGDDIQGDGVNIADRLQGLAEPGGICIAASVHEQVKNKLDFVFEDLGPRKVKNIAEPLRVFRMRAHTNPANEPMRAPMLGKARIAVLPFANMSDDPRQVYFSDGITEDITTELSRFRSLFVIARNSSFVFRNEQISVAEVARRLGVQYVVEGSVRRAANRIRITAQLIDATSDAHLWAERYDRELEDIFDVQDEVVRTIVATLVGQVEAAGTQFAKRKPPDSMVAYDYVLRGLEELSLEGEEHNTNARRLFEKAVELDPEYASGHACLALAIYVQWVSPRSSGELERALVSARRALALDESDTRCHRILSVIYKQLKQYDRAEFHSERSISLNPGDALCAMYRAQMLRDLGRADEGVEWARKSMSLNPYHPNWYWRSFAYVLHDAGLYAEALDAYSRIIDRPSFYHAYVAACHAKLGQMEEARKHAAMALEAKPDFSVTEWGKRLAYKNDDDRQRFLDGLRNAGLPE
jgi:adenylate cyclase